VTEHRPWFASYQAEVPHTLEPYPRTSVFSMLESSARRFPDRPAMAWFGRHMSYRFLLAEVERFSAVLSTLGVGKGDRVGLILPNCPQYVANSLPSEAAQNSVATPAGARTKYSTVVRYIVGVTSGWCLLIKVNADSWDSRIFRSLGV